jgi:hypothetical protein
MDVGEGRHLPNEVGVHRHQGGRRAQEGCRGPVWPSALGQFHPFSSNDLTPQAQTLPLDPATRSQSYDFLIYGYNASVVVG